MVKTAAECLLSSEEKLNGFDKESGDGDCGSTMARGAQGIVVLPYHVHHATYRSLLTTFSSDCAFNAHVNVNEHNPDYCFILPEKNWH